jgi:Protein of unknown function (DUF3987)
MTRAAGNWLDTYLKYTEGTETPKLIHFWTGVVTLAGVMRRKLWIDMKRFQWYPNFYVIIVAPPGIISKTTTMDIGLNLLKEVPGINFGPDVVTWQALVKRFSEINEMFQYGEDFLPMSAMTLASGELGNLINFADRDMLNAYIALWDARAKFDKETKTSGSEAISGPWINMIGCTTPHWVAENVPQAAVGGGFTSRCIFVYAEEKIAYVALPDEVVVDADHKVWKESLIADLTHISLNLTGAFTLDASARNWIRPWYEELWKSAKQSASADQIDGFIARKQTHLMKLAMVLSVSESDSLIISERHVRLSDMMVSATEKDLPKVFARIGRSEESLHAERLLDVIRRHSPLSYESAFRAVYAQFPSFKDFSTVLEGLIRSGQVRLDMSESAEPTKAKLHYLGRL